MHVPRQPFLLSLLVLAAALAGCMGSGDGESTGNGTQPATNVTVSPPPATNGTRTHFRVSAIEILAPDGTQRALYEDDEKAIVRYTVSQPSDAPFAEAAFVTYILNDRILDVQQVHLAPGQERAYERTVEGLRDHRSLRVEVRAGSASERNESTVQAWPRAGEDALQVGPVSVRADYGLLEQDGRILVNLTLVNTGTEEVRDFRVKMLCVDASGEVETTKSHDVPAPTPGNRTGADVFLDDCAAGSTRYGLEVKGRDSTGDLWGRLLLVPEGWRPSPTPA